MAYRRKYFKVRRFRRRRRLYQTRKRRYGKRRRCAKRGDFLLKATSLAAYNLQTTPSAVVIDPQLSDFSEASVIAGNFEYFQITKVVMRIVPNFTENLAISTAIPPYVIAPWHRLVSNTATITQTNCLTLDKHKFVNGSRGVRMAFTPAVQLNVGTAPAGVVDYKFKPKLSTTANTVKHHCGLLAFPAYAPATGIAAPTYSVHITAYFKFYDQKLNIE